MPTNHEIRADYDRDSIAVYQAYDDAIADAALAAGRFVPPFSMRRMTWIKPSFLWLMARSKWGQRAGQRRILRVQVSRAGWDEALRLGVLTAYDARAHRVPEAWDQAFREAVVHVQWDPERSLRGAKLPHRSIQVGLSRHVIERYATTWVTGIADMTPTVQKMRAHLGAGQAERARRLLPPERPYPVPDAVGVRLGMRA